MSYIAFDLDALNVARDVGAAASLSEERITHGLLRMWAWCFREKTDTVSVIQVQGFFGPEAAPALVAFGFLAQTENGFRVRGAERYLRVTKQRSEAGRARSSSAGRSAGKFTSGQPADNQRQPAEHQRTTSEKPALTPSTEHLAPNTLKAAAAGSAPLTTAIGWWVEAQRRRETAGLHKESPPHPGKLEGWFAEAMLETNGDEQKLLGGYDAFLVDPFWRNEADKRCAWSGWLNQWRDFVTRATAPPVPGRRDARGPAQPSTGFTNSISEGF